MKRILKNKFPFAFVGLFLWFVSCRSVRFSGLENGDLLFVTAKDSGLSGAINNVTQKEENTSFDHIGILKIEKGKAYVLHSAPKGGSQKQTLENFSNEQHSEGQKIVVYRLKSEFQNAVPNALNKAEAMLGKPYNFNYILDENSYYCSDFIERSFRDNGIFRLEPMTFIDPKTGKTNTFWAKFYAEKGLSVPEGEPGCNPNGLASSEKLFRVKVLKFNK